MLIAVLALLILLGCFMDSLSMILVVVPFLWPTLVAINGGDYAAGGDGRLRHGDRPISRSGSASWRWWWWNWD